jgi:hypothetical protein
VSKFKTVLTYGFQSIVLSKPAIKVLRFYLSHLRPQAVKRCAEKSARIALKQPKAPLWLNFDSTKMKEAKLGFYTSRFFEEQASLHLTTDMLRVLLETHTYNEHLLGNVTTEERAAITSLNNHSSGTVKKFYLLNDNRKVVEMGARVMSRMVSTAFDENGAVSAAERTGGGDGGDDGDGGDGGGSSSRGGGSRGGGGGGGDGDEEEEEDNGQHRAEARLGSPSSLHRGSPSRPSQASRVSRDIITTTTAAPCDIGVKHSVGASAKRAKWDQAELDYLLSSIQTLRSVYLKKGVVNPTLMADCRERILADDYARTIFHCRHVLTSARLRAGYESLIKAGEINE